MLCASGLRFGGVVRVVEKYWEAGPGSVYMTCCDIEYQQMGSCGNRPEKCVICAGSHKVEDHQCGVIGCKKKKSKICIYVIPKCANLMRAHAANSSRCVSRYKVEIDVKKRKRAQKIENEKESPSSICNKVDDEEKEASPQLDMDMELEVESWAQSPISVPKYEVDGSLDEIPEGKNYSKKYEC